MQLTSLAAVKRACQPGARLVIVTTDVPHIQLTQAHGPRPILQATTKAIAVRGSHRRHGQEGFDPDVLSWLTWPRATGIELHGDDTFTIPGLARYRVLPAAKKHASAA